MIIRDSDPSGMNVCIIPLVSQLRSAQVLAKDEKNFKWMVEEGDDRHQLGPQNQG